MTALPVFELRPAWVQRLRSLRRRQRRRPGRVEGIRSSRRRGLGLDYLETRGYEAGDDIRHVDWKVSARTGALHTKVYADERGSRRRIYVATWASMALGRREANKLHLALQAAGLLAAEALYEGDVVDLFFVGERVEPAGSFRSPSRLAALSRVLAERAAQPPEGFDPQWPLVLERDLRQARPRPQSVALIGDLLTAQAIGDPARGGPRRTLVGIRSVFEIPGPGTRLRLRNPLGAGQAGGEVRRLAEPDTWIDEDSDLVACLAGAPWP